jgi:hypothetical protein
MTFSTVWLWMQPRHCSVKEFLTSPRLRLATASGEDSDYHIDLGPTHPILAQACIGVLLQLQVRIGRYAPDEDHPLAPYAPKHWTTHAQLGGVVTFIKRDGISLRREQTTL